MAWSSLQSLRKLYLDSEHISPQMIGTSNGEHAADLITASLALRKMIRSTSRIISGTHVLPIKFQATTTFITARTFISNQTCYWRHLS
jgi:head-tail adaptor